MAAITIPDATYAQLANRASRVGVSVEEFVLPSIEAEPVTEETVSQPLRGEAWLRAFENIVRVAKQRADRYPPGHALDTSRVSICEEQIRRQL